MFSSAGYAMLCYFMLYVLKSLFLPNWFKSSLSLLALEKAAWICPIDLVSKQSCLHTSKVITFNVIDMNKVCEQCRNKKWGKSTLKIQQDLPLSAQDIKIIFFSNSFNLGQ